MPAKLRAWLLYCDPQLNLRLAAVTAETMPKLQALAGPAGRLHVFIFTQTVD
jgi:hypothetical protein